MSTNKALPTWAVTAVTPSAWLATKQAYENSKLR